MYGAAAADRASAYVFSTGLVDWPLLVGNKLFLGSDTTAIDREPVVLVALIGGLD